MICYTIRLTEAEADELKAIINKDARTSQTFQVANILLNCDAGKCFLCNRKNCLKKQTKIQENKRPGNTTGEEQWVCSKYGTCTRCLQKAFVFLFFKKNKIAA